MSFKKIFHFTKNNVIALVGFMLSPFSWWNDLVVNFPLAYFFAIFVGRILNFFISIDKDWFAALFVLGYFLTNIAGMMMLKSGATNLLKYEKKSHLSYKSDLIIALIYSLVGVWLILGNYGSFLSYLKIIPDWVK